MHSLYELVLRALEAVSQGSVVALLVLFLVATFTEMGVPFPFIIDGVLFVTGYRTGVLSVHMWLLMFSLFLGRIAGSTIIYWGSRYLQKPVMGWLNKRFPAICSRIEKVCSRLGTKAPVAVALARLTPGLLTPSSVAAGIINLRYDYFVYGIALSSIIADASLVLFRFAAGRGMHRLGLAQSIWIMWIGLVAAIALIWLVRRFFLRSR